MTKPIKPIQKMSYKDIIIRSLSNQLKATMVDNIKLRNEVDLLQNLLDEKQSHLNKAHSDTQKMLESSNFELLIEYGNLKRMFDLDHVNDHKISFIKNVRNMTGCGLREAKTVLDTFTQNHVKIRKE
ncbi:hypothetical protein SUFG_00069 [Sulfitobacter phage phiCB2047-B]|uniref:Large ribosomal subunit protein bL12 C-terminal domain-containing protein n=1 Tax=Sulfitobacter phage phiCB2047-B TaxID=754046 RepID=M4PRQ8_9CAUD|nr:hypothetical protein SUFG_00069 [Sulfitobacter phage phiCB2047-B]AGH07436.1 hypothetical protein SUFG_00069 [Sulfitobacter phage phiCB2047-B]